VRHYQIIQEGNRRVTLLVVQGDGWNEVAADRLRDGMSNLLGPGLEAGVRTVAEVPPERSGGRSSRRSRNSTDPGVAAPPVIG